ncbi:hypothetical protein KC345_g10145, partial [Hortaea werneckii]
LKATSAHLHMAASHGIRNAKPHPHDDDLFWTFASSTKLPNIPPITPAMQALGNGSSATPGQGGVNHRLVPILREMRGQRLGIVMFDFYEEPSELLDVYLGLLPPE